MDRPDHPETDEPAGLTLAVGAVLIGVPEDAWTEGPLDDVALRLHRLRGLIALAADRAAACEQTLIDSMEANTVVVPHVGEIIREPKTTSTWKHEHASARLRDDLTTAVATTVAMDNGTGEIDPVKRNIARATMALAYEAIPSFSSLNKAGRERLGLHIGDYRDFGTTYKIVIKSMEDPS